MLELRNISIAFEGKPVLTGCSLSLQAGERVALMGPSGCGKTTLLRIALGLQAPDSGEVFLDAEQIAMVFQEPRLLPWRTAAENVNLVLSDRADTLSEAEGWLSKLGLGEASALYPGELSGGMRQRVALARALAMRPKLLVLDEPFQGLDDALRDHVLRTLTEEAGGAAILMATHSMAEAEALGCRILRYQEPGIFA